VSTARRTLFVVLDGIDGCGKSTQAARLASRLRAETGAPVEHVREPGSTCLGEALRAMLLSREHAPVPRAEALLFAAARAQMLAEIAAPALARGTHVVCERFHASTFAYQAVAGGVDERAVLDLLRAWAGDPRPTLELLLSIDPAQAGARRGAAGDRIEDKGLAFQRAVARGYARYAELAPDTRVLDGARGADEVAMDVWREVARALG
jgi:dTMP kinase